MGLNPDLLRGIYAYGKGLFVKACFLRACRFRKAFGHSAACHSSHYQRQRRYRSIPVRNGKDRCVLHRRAPEHRSLPHGDAGPYFIAHARVGGTITESASFDRRLHESAVPRVRWRQKPERRHPPSGLRCAGRLRDSRPRIRHDQPPSPAYAQHQDPHTTSTAICPQRRKWCWFRRRCRRKCWT